MNALEKIALLPDMQSQVDNRDLRIDAVGINRVRYPMTLRAGDRPLPTIAILSMSVALPAVAKGTHISRFVELLEAQTEALDPAGFKTIVLDMLERLEARSGSIEMRFPYFVRKTAPVSGAQSQVDYEVCWRGSVSDEERYSFRMLVTVPATSLCPCSKEISAYGAHNQRSHISIDAELAGEMQRNNKFRLVATMTGMTKSSRPWDGETGLIDGNLVKKVVGDVSAPIYYVVGPPGMVEAMRQTLNRAGINDDDIRSEAFYGY